MKFLDRLVRRLSDNKQAVEVWSNPTDYNRAARRSFGVRGRISPFAPEAVVFVPRFVRRNWPRLNGASTPLTRRNRKRRARIDRQMVAYGLARAR